LKQASPKATKKLLKIATNGLHRKIKYIFINKVCTSYISYLLVMKPVSVVSPNGALFGMLRKIRKKPRA
jgi:hypothetical protein